MNVLLTSGGRRVALLRAFRQAFELLEIEGRIIVCDLSPLSSAFMLADVAETVPRVTAPDYVERLLDICRAHNVRLLVPLIDPELPILAAARARFEAIGTIPVVSGVEAMDISDDKFLTERFFREAGIPTPAVLDPAQVLAGEVPLPVFLKPNRGSSSIGSRRIDSPEELEYWLPRTCDPVLMECAQGVEYTVDVYAGLDGHVYDVAVPRRRLQVRAGEVEKGLTDAVPVVMETALKAARALPEVRGVLTFQCILGQDGVPRFFELNARFGGGAPLSIEAGAHFPRWLVEEALGRSPSIGTPAFEDRLLMVRFDDALFVHNPPTVP